LNRSQHRCLSIFGSPSKNRAPISLIALWESSKKEEMLDGSKPCYRGHPSALFAFKSTEFRRKTTPLSGKFHSATRSLASVRTLCMLTTKSHSHCLFFFWPSIGKG
jgi:hypothetical protein